MRTSLGFASLISILLSRESFGCSCGITNICTRAEKTPVIFLGEVIEGGLEPAEDMWKGTARSARLKVIESFRGLPGDAKEVTISLSFMPGMCSPMPYRRGERTLVFVGPGYETADALRHG